MLIPVLHRVIVVPDPVETTTKSGIIISQDEKAQRKATDKGMIHAMGDTAFSGQFATDSPPKVGDRVVYAKYSGAEVEDVDGTKFTILNDEDIIVIIKE